MAAKKKTNNNIDQYLRFKDFKVYVSPESVNREEKRYRVVFDQQEATYIYAEYSFYNKKFDEEDWYLDFHLKCFNNKTGDAICDMDLSKDVYKTENTVYIRQGWGNDNPWWKKGEYRWEAWSEGNMLAKVDFYVVNVGLVKEAENPFFEITSIKLYEAAGGNIPDSDRKHYKQFDREATRYIWFEFKAENHRKESYPCEINFNFRTQTGELKGHIHYLKWFENYQAIYFNDGWGHETAPTWYHGRYTLEVVFMDQLVAVVPFEVGNGFIEAEDSSVTNFLPTVDSKGRVQKPKAQIDSSDDVMKELEEMIGLKSVKKKVKEYSQYLQFLQFRKEKGLADDERITLHSVFTGNPGTGKTTVALLLGKIYKSLGLLTRGHVIHADRAMLVGEYIGQTAPKTKKVIDDSRGGILFIDEAYSLARKGEVDSKDFGREVIEVLLKEMSDPNCDFAVVVAGYPEEMYAFLESNPGLKSRFNYYFEFDDYTPKELMQIAEYASKKRNIQFSKEAKELFYEELVDAYRKRTKTFGNARLVNSWIDESKMNMGLRLMQHPDLQNLTPEELSTIQKVDVEKIFQKEEKEYVDIPIDEELLAESLNAVNKLVGMENVKQDINELVKLIRFYRETGKNVRNLSLHTVFTGNPGTGKTTVARLLADIFKALGILERGHLVEVTRKDLVAGYIGQTAILTNEQINKAMGGVLFIDEAYSLTSSGYSGDFGKEAVETILKRMEDDRGKFIIIAAGYTQNMKEFLQANPGLSSRFDRTFHFEDSKPDALLTIAENLLKEEKLELDSAAKLHLKTYLENAYKYRDKNFGNARMVRKIIEKTIKNQHLRLANLPAEERKPEIMNIVTLKDVEEFKMDESIKGNRIGFMV